METRSEGADGRLRTSDAKSPMEGAWAFGSALSNIRPLRPRTFRYVLPVVYPCVCNLELADAKRKPSLIGIDCLMCRHAKFRLLANHGTP
jgi:hypothetical protein